MSVFEINQKFRTQMITGILSRQLLYIPHYHCYSYVDKVLREIFPENGNPNSIFGLKRVKIMEVPIDGDVIDFQTKKEYRNRNVAELLDEIISYNDTKLNNVDFEDDQLVFLINKFSRDIQIHLHSA